MITMSSRSTEALCRRRKCRRIMTRVERIRPKLERKGLVVGLGDVSSSGVKPSVISANYYGCVDHLGV